MAASAGRVWQLEQRVPTLSTMGHDRRVRCHARDAGRTGGARHGSRHDRQHGGPGTSLCRRHKKGTQQTEALGRSRGGFTTKLHARCDARGLPLGFVLTPGQAHDVQGFAPLFRMITDQIEAFLADRGYDADTIREEIEAAGVEAVIPAKVNRRNPAPHDRAKYKWRNLIERLFNKLKNWRRIATRYDKTRESYLGFVALASVKLWIPFVHET